MLTYILLLLVLAIAAIFVLASKKPDEFRVTRNILINAPASIIFEQVNDLEKGHKWSPWVEMEPDADYKFEGPKSGVGATLNWEGKKTGKGTMVITEVKPDEFVRNRLEFYKPMRATNTAEFKLDIQGDKTQVTWTMYGPNNFIGKIMSLFMNCEKMVGDQFEKGLSNLKSIVESKKL